MCADISPEMPSNSTSRLGKPAPGSVSHSWSGRQVTSPVPGRTSSWTPKGSPRRGRRPSPDFRPLPDLTKPLPPTLVNISHDHVRVRRLRILAEFVSPSPASQHPLLD